jgi:hypothetical protein
VKILLSYERTSSEKLGADTFVQREGALRSDSGTRGPPQKKLFPGGGAGRAKLAAQALSQKIRRKKQKKRRRRSLVRPGARRLARCASAGTAGVRAARLPAPVAA